MPAMPATERANPYAAPPKRYVPTRRIPLPAALRGKPLRWMQRFAAGLVHDYPHRNLLAIGQPKSGSTWLLRMLGDVPGYFRWTPPNIKIGYHDLDRQRMLRPPLGYTVTKTHTAPTPENIAIIEEAGRPYVVLVRDPRDLAVSWAHYIATQRRYAAVPDAVREAPLDARLDHYIEHVLPRTVRWATDWRVALDRQRGMLIRYEDMLDDAAAVMGRVFAHFEVGLAPDAVRAIVERRSFRRETGRAPGREAPGDFNRKGIAGDWRNHFTAGHAARCKAIAGGALIDLGYEASADW